MRAQRPSWQSWLLTLRRYVTFFLTMAFVISCCMLLFVSQLQATLGGRVHQGADQPGRPS